MRHLSAAQLAHRVRLRAQRAVLRRAGELVAPHFRRPVGRHPGWPADFVALDARLPDGFPSAEANADGRFRFLGEERRLGQPHDWEQREAAQLWCYQLHYFEWAWAFANHPDRQWARGAFIRLWSSWRGGTDFGRWDAWSPYVASLRAWALCGLHRPLVAGAAEEREFLSHLALHAGFVRANLELDVGGNHLVKNLKALVGLGVFLGDETLVEVGARHLGHEVRTQVLGDGAHFERSPFYHCQVLADLIDVASLLGAARHAPVDGLGDAIAAMQRWLGAMLMPDGDVPLFNDCVLVGPDRVKLLEPAPPPPRRLIVLQPSGYVVVRSGEHIHLVADVGPPCPPELPAHAHADCLSFEMAVDGQRLVVDTGTSTYERGDRRSYERSTRAHNTVEVDGQDQTEVWGIFRAARRAEGVLERATDEGDAIEVVASHNGYRRLPDHLCHRRTWRASPTGVEVTDEVSGSGTGSHSAVAGLHLAPGLVPRALRSGAFDVGPARVTLWGGTAGMDQVHVATRFGSTQLACRLSLVCHGALPCRLRTVIEVGFPGEGASA